MADKLIKPETKVTTFIQRKISYVDEHKRVVDESIIVMGEPPEDFVRFAARASLKAKFEGGTATKSFKVPLPRATTIQEAFAQIVEEYDAAMAKAEKAVRGEIKDKMAQDMAEQALVKAPGDILGKDGTIPGMAPPRLAKGGKGRGRRG